MATEPNDVRRSTFSRGPEMLRVKSLPDHPLISYNLQTLQKTTGNDMRNSNNLVTARNELLRTISEKEEPIRVIEQCKSSNHVSGCSPGNPATWRGDGKFFATISSVQNSLQKKLKVWERDTGNLHSVSEPKASMGEIVEWMPSGAKIATVCDQKIVFFEKNGLERNSFSVGEGIDATIENLKWNCNSDLLAAIGRME
nr:IKI3-like protein [Tanacetum cinerariifolium]